MGLLSLLKRLNSEQKNIRVLVLGLENSGKTSLVQAFVNLTQNSKENDVEERTSPTIGCEIQKIIFKDFQISFWDIGGSISSKSYWNIYYDSSDILMWVIDSSDIDKFEESKNELESILQNDKLIRASLIVVASKQDDSNAAPFPDFIRDLEINVNGKNWTAIVSGNQGTEKGDFSDELENCLEWIIDDFSTKKKLNVK